MNRERQLEPVFRRLLRPALPHWLALLVLLAALVGSSGCITSGPKEWIRNGFKVGPSYCRPPVPVADEWIQARDRRVQSRHLRDWWTVFQDEKLNCLIDRAFEQNLTLRVMAMRVLQARAQQGIAAGNLFTQTQQLQGTYLNGTANAHPSWINLTYFNLSWEIDFWGRIRRGIESANATLDASVESYDDALVTLLSDVATNYVQYRTAQQRIKVARANVRIQEEIVAIVERQERVGLRNVTMVDVNQVRTALEQTRATIPELQIALGQANDTLCILLGMPPHDLEHELGPGPELGDGPMPNTPTWVAAGIPADLVRRRPDVRAAERRVAAQSAQIGVAEADLLPRLAINGIIGYDAISAFGLPASNGFLGFYNPNFTWNILNYGRILNNVRAQKARFYELVATYQNQVLTAGREASVALRSFLRSQEQAEDLARSVNAAQAALDVGRSQLRAGTTNVNTIFNLELNQVQQQNALVSAQGSIALYLINVYRAIGGGWEIRLEDRCSPELSSDPAVEAGPADRSSRELPEPRKAPRSSKEGNRPDRDQGEEKP